MAKPTVTKLRPSNGARGHVAIPALSAAAWRKRGMRSGLAIDESIAAGKVTRSDA